MRRGARGRGERRRPSRRRLGFVRKSARRSSRRRGRRRESPSTAEKDGERDRSSTRVCGSYRVRYLVVVTRFVTLRRAMRKFAVVIPTLLLLLLLGCGRLKEPTEPVLGGEPIDPTATLTRVQNEIFTPTCSQIGCHDRLGQQSQQVL